jgi:hypothetical protein
MRRVTIPYHGRESVQNVCAVSITNKAEGFLNSRLSQGNETLLVSHRDDVIRRHPALVMSPSFARRAGAPDLSPMFRFCG